MAKRVKDDINEAIEFAIEEHLSVLNSDIILPMRNKKVNDLRLLATVTSRDTVYNNLVAMLDNPKINSQIKIKSQRQILSGLKKTNEELITKIIKRPMKPQNTEEEEVKQYLSIEEALELEKSKDVETSDDVISSVSKAVRTAVDLVILIKDRIDLIERPEAAKQKKLDAPIPSIVERYARNR